MLIKSFLMIIINVIGLVFIISVFVSWNLNIETSLMAFDTVILVVGLLLFLIENKEINNKWYDQLLFFSIFCVCSLAIRVLESKKINVIDILFSDIYFVVSVSIFLILFLVRRKLSVIKKGDVNQISDL